LSLWRRRLRASFGRFLLEQSFQTALNGALSHGAGNVPDVGLRFRARKFSGQIEWDLKPALIIGEILGLLCAANDVLGKLLGQQEQGAKINGVVECEPAFSLRFEFGRGNHEIVGAGFAVADGCRPSQLLEFGVLRAEDCRVFVSDIGRDEVGRTGNPGRTCLFLSLDGVSIWDV